MLGSFLVKDQLSRKDLDQISKLSEEELNSIIQSRLKNADSRIDSAIDDKMDEALAISTRAMERTSNEKIMAINEYSDTVLDAMDKTHNEIMFLYSMLNDKHKELTDLAGELSSFSNQMRATENAALRKLAEAAEKIEDDLQNPETIDRETVEVLAEAVHQQKTGDERNHNDDILLLHSMGKTDVEIAKELGLGLGEVKLVIGLFKEDEID
jgi:phage-related protein